MCGGGINSCELITCVHMPAQLSFWGVMKTQGFLSTLSHEERLSKDRLIIGELV